MISRARPKIIYILPSYNPAIGSHFFHLYELLHTAAEHLDIFVVIERSASEPSEFPLPHYRQRFTLLPLRFLELFAVLFRERMRGRRFFYTHYSLFGGAASWLVTAFTGGVPYYWNAGMPWLYRRPCLEEALFRFILRHTRLVTATASLAGEYVRHYGPFLESPKIMPNWINLQRFQNGLDRPAARRTLAIDEDAKVVLFVHRLSRRKGAELLADIAARVLECEKHAIFVIVGDGPEKQNLESRIRNQGLLSNVRIIGEVPHRDVPRYFRAADVFLMPSEEEGFPHVLLEAMAAGVPYVASDVGGVRDITPSRLRSFLIPSGDSKTAAEKILSLLNASPSLVQKVIQEERDCVRRYDLLAVAPMFVSLFI